MNKRLKALCNTLITLTLIFISSYSYSQIYGEEIISFDFNEGIPENWENSSESGIGIWEYRGPLSTPDNTVASRGSCGAQSDPVGSSTNQNGFIIFDSNYWDDDIGPCGNLASGIDPGPHSADLITAPIDFSGETSLVLTFQQQYKNFECATTVSISADGGNNYTTVIANSDQTGFYSGDLNFASVNISALAANQPDVRIKFHFEGLYYYWMIDDIVIYKPNNNDLFMTEARYTAFDFMQGSSGIGKMEYSIYPRTMITPFQFHADALNIGNNTQTDVTLTAKVLNQTDEELATLSSTPISVTPGISSTLVTEEYLPSNILGPYQIDFEIEQAEEDEDQENNIVSKYYRISEYSFARDKYEMDGEFTPAENFTSSHFELGNYFEGTISEPLKCTSISVAFSENSSVGATANGLLLNLLRDSVIAETLPYEINSWDLNQVGEAKFVTLQFTSPYVVLDTLFLGSISSFQDDGLVRIATSGISPAQTTIIEYPSDNSTFYTLVTPMIRVNLFPLSSSPGCTNISAFNFDPLADIDDGSCRIAGCTTDLSTNYNPLANFDDGSCEFVGCDDPDADNYSPDIEIIDNETCLYSGCTDVEAFNFDEQANFDDGSCEFVGCDDPDADNYNPDAEIIDNETCLYSGCTDAEAFNFDEQANFDDGSCEFVGCDDPDADNYNPNAEIIDNETCLYSGCTDAEALNFDEEANLDDGSCLYNIAILFVSEEIGCAPFTIEITNQTLLVEGADCSFDLGEGTIIEECELDAYAHTYDSPGEYTIIYTYTVGDFISTDEIIITVNEAEPTPILEYLSDVNQIICNNCVNENNYNWILDDVVFLESAPFDLFNPQNGTYILELDNGSNCTAQSSPLVVTYLDEKKLELEIDVYPNPTSDYIQIFSPFSSFDFQIIDLSGKVLATGMLSSPGIHTINLTKFPAGVYLIKSITRTYRFIKA